MARDSDRVHENTAASKTLQVQNEDSLTLLRSKLEDQDKFRDRVGQLCRKLGIIDITTSLTLETLDLLETTVSSIKGLPRIMTKKTSISQAAGADISPTRPLDSLPQATITNIKRPRRKVTRNEITDLKTPSAAGESNSPKAGSSTKDTQRKETNVEATRKVSSKEAMDILPQLQRPSPQSHHPLVAIIEDTQTESPILPLSQIEAGNDRTLLTSPLPDLSHLFPRTPGSSGENVNMSNAPKSQKLFNSNRTSKDKPLASKNQAAHTYGKAQASLSFQPKPPEKSSKGLNAIASPSSHKQGNNTTAKTGVPQESVKSRPFQSFPDFSSPSMDSVDLINVDTMPTSGVDPTKETGKGDPGHRFAASGASSKSALFRSTLAQRRGGPGNNGFRPSDEKGSTSADPHTPNMLRLADEGAPPKGPKLSGLNGTTKGILKNGVPALSVKRKQSTAESQDVVLSQGNKRLKVRDSAAASPVVADSQSPALSRQPHPIGGATQQRISSPSVNDRTTTSRGRRRNQTSGGELIPCTLNTIPLTRKIADRYELRFRQETG